jgi:glycosyltransferase involved in cell wall biosynthesis
MLEPWAFRHKAAKKKVAWMIYQKRDLASALRLHATSLREGMNLERMNPGAAVTLIPNGVDLPPADYLHRPGRSPRTALFVGRIYPVKGLPMLVEAWRRVQPPGWRLVIAGPDEAGHRASIERQILAAGISGSVSFAGPVSGDEKTRLFAESELFVLPTHSENFGIAIGEALAHGLPVLTTTGAPWPQLLERDCGWQVDISEDGIAGGLRRATSLESGALAEMGERGSQLIAADFQWTGVARRFISLYDSCRAAS